MHLQIASWAAILITWNILRNIAQNVLFLSTYIWPLHL